MIENTAQEAENKKPEEEIAVEVTDDNPAPQQAEGDSDELEKYTKGVSKRINKLNAKTRAAEERATQLERLAMEKRRSSNNTELILNNSHLQYWQKRRKLSMQKAHRSMISTVRP